MEIEPVIVISDEDEIDIHDSEALAQMTDRELLEIIVVYQCSLDNRLSVIEDAFKQIDTVMQSLLSNPMLAMLIPDEVIEQVNGE